MVETGDFVPCAYCGERPGEEPDHVIPRSLFPKPRPDDMITVPACPECNRSFSKDEEAFRQYLSILVGVGDRARDVLWADAIRGFQHNQRLRREVLRQAKDIEIVSPAGLYLGTWKAVHWPAEAHDPILCKIARGLHYYHRGYCLPRDVAMEPKWLSRDMDLRGFPVDGYGSIGGEMFQYVYTIDESSDESVWVFQFHRRHLAGVVVGRSETVPTAVE